MMRMFKESIFKNRQGYIKWLVGIGICFILFLLLPVPKLEAPTCSVLYSKEGKLMGARLGADEQWRFPQCDSVPERFEKALLLFEDQYFYFHPGVNPGAILRALLQNLRSGEIVSGGSTITMQVVRISRGGKARTIFEKLIESVLALRLELSLSKQEILKIYASNAPFGGNVVGIDAASWRYFGRSAHQLSWAEATTLAVLPNAPALIFPGKNQTLLMNKRNRVLQGMHKKGIMDAMTLSLALQEALPVKPHALPMMAPHLLTRFTNSRAGESIRTGIHYQLQKQCNEIVKQHARQLRNNEIHNMCALVLDVKSSQVLAYVGNTPAENNENHGNDVDIIQAPRSSGSILKPLLYCACMNDGEFLPHALIPDVPIYMDGFAPKNYNLSNEGAVKASQALSRSLNVPAVHMLKEYNTSKFHHLLRVLNFSTITYSPDHYGLTLILGGAEVTLWDLCRVYAGMSLSLNDVAAGKSYPDNAYKQQNLEYRTQVKDEEEIRPFNAAAIYQTFMAMQEVNRPDSEAGWEHFSSSYKIAWKTGTSFGYRDAWAVGVTPEYVVGVWAGNADGEGRPELTGVTAAAPVMFEIFDYLNPQEQFSKPYAAFEQVKVCKESGFLASPNCEHFDTIEVAPAGRNSRTCPYHRIVHLDPSGRFRVTSSCMDPSEMRHKSWFVLPPAMAWYYQKKHSAYQALPPFLKGCNTLLQNKSLEIVYPESGANVFIPKEMNGEKGRVVCEAIHQNEEMQLFWHMDDRYIGATQGLHQIEIQPPPGQHTLVLMDEDGNSVTRNFVVMGSR